MRREPTETAAILEGLREEGFSVPTKRIVCPCCDGRGHYVNPAVDGHGIGADEMFEDPDFADDYRRGHYDVTCAECHGANVIEVLDTDRAPAVVVVAFEDWQNDLAESCAITAAELRMGA